MRKELLSLLILLSSTLLTAQVSPTMPPPNRNMTGRNPHVSPGVHPETVAGTVEGFVYWDANGINHIPADNCSGLAITVSVGSSSGGPLTAYTALGTISNNFKHVGQVKEFLSGGGINVYDVCSYAYDKVPVGPPLQVKLTVTQAAAFSPVSTPQYEILGPITIINGRCNMLPHILNPNASDLTANWGSCQNMAYNVNFAMLHPGARGTRAPSGSRNVLLGANSGTSASPILKNPGAMGTPMLSGSPQQGMLATGAPATVQSSSSGGGVQSPAAAVGSGSVMSTRYGNVANAATGMKLPSGTVTGFVYWQMSVFQPQADCQGLTVKIITVNNSGMPLQLLSSTSSLAASGPMTDYSAMGTPKYMLCSYSFQNIPEKVSLRALLYGMPSTASVATPAAFQISGGNCNSTPSGTLSFILTGGPMLCGDGAYNINFKLTAPASTNARSPENSTLLRNITSGPPHGLLAQPPAQNPNVSSPASGATTLLPSGPGASSQTASQSNNGTLHNEGSQITSGPIDRGRQSAAGTTPGATRQTLTNADVLKMLKAGVPESVIISSIQSAAHTFDLSPEGCHELKAAHVTQQVLDAMGPGGVQPCTPVLTGPHSNASDVPEKTLMVPNEQKPLRSSQTSGPGDDRKRVDDSNSRSLPPHDKATDPKVVQLLQKPGAGKTGPVVNRPQLARETAAIIAILQKQRSVADVEVGQLTHTMQPATVAGAVGGPSQLMSATGSAGPSGPTPGAGGNLSLNGGRGSSGSTGNIPSSISHEHSFNNTAIICSTDPTLRILNVSGSAGAATFTPIDQYDLYTITGCSFGNTTGKVYIYGTGSFQENFVVKFWSENSIVVSLDSSLSGLPDLDNITLVVQRNDNLQTQKTGFNFYAARETVPLKQIPQSWVVELQEVRTDSTNTVVPAQYSSPPSLPPGPSAGTLYVSRFYDGEKFWQIGGNDNYDLSRLAPGWTADSFQVTTYPQTCPFTVTYRQDFFEWSWEWDMNNILISISATTCSGFFAGMPLKNYQNWTGSYYALQVWVSGPRGLDPLTNHPVSQ